MAKKPEKGKPIEREKGKGRVQRDKERSELVFKNKTVKGKAVTTPNKPTSKAQSVKGEAKGKSESPDVKGGPADDVSVREFFNIAKNTVTAAMSGNFSNVFSNGSKLLSVAFDLLGFSGWGSTDGADDVKDEEWDNLLSECEEAKKCVESENAVGADENTETDPKKINPAVVILIIELVVKIAEWIRKRRNPTPVTETNEETPNTEAD